MAYEVIFLGGVSGMGANSMYLNIEGTGIIIDAGLHPKKRDAETFPLYELIKDKTVDLVILTHAHTDHIGALPYLLKFFPHVKIFTTRPTRDLMELVLNDTAKLLKSEATEIFENELLSLYDKKVLQRIWMLAESYQFKEIIQFVGLTGKSNLQISLHHSGHIIGSSSVLIDFDNKCLIVTGDINFRDQALLKGAELPNHHIDCLITECTNGGNHALPTYSEETKRFAKYLNLILNNNGSVLIPAFALGKTQEILQVINSLIHSGKIPKTPIFTGGLGTKINRIYDKYCYEVPMKQPGFEVSDIEQTPIEISRLLRGDYFKEPGIVIASSGMMNEGTISYKLAKEWLLKHNYGIAFIGYLDPDTPGWQVLNSEKHKDFEIGSIHVNRRCEVEQFRFSSHASHQDIIENIYLHSPNEVFLVHGDEEALFQVYHEISQELHSTKISIPQIGYKYNICKSH